jgi:hypothetical protein
MPNCTCPKGWYDDGVAKCKKCPTECKTCDDGKCTTCKDDRQQKPPKCPCKDG